MQNQSQRRRTRVEEFGGCGGIMQVQEENLEREIFLILTLLVIKDGLGKL